MMGEVGGDGVLRGSISEGDIDILRMSVYIVHNCGLPVGKGNYLLGGNCTVRPLFLLIGSYLSRVSVSAGGVVNDDSCSRSSIVICCAAEDASVRRPCEGAARQNRQTCRIRGWTKMDLASRCVMATGTRCNCGSSHGSAVATKSRCSWWPTSPRKVAALELMPTLHLTQSGTALQLWHGWRCWAGMCHGVGPGPFHFFLCIQRRTFRSTWARKL